MTYEYVCKKGHSQDGWFPMGKQPSIVPCNVKGCLCQAKHKITGGDFHLNGYTEQLKEYRRNPANQFEVDHSVG